MKSMLLLSASLFLMAQLSAQAPAIEFQEVSLTGPALVDPVDIVAANDGSGRLFIVEKRGTVRIISEGVVSSGYFLDVRPLGILTSGEMGLLGLVFHPDYPAEPYLYVNYVKPVGTTGRYSRIARFEMNPDNPDDALENTEFVIMDVTQPYENHNAGDMAFGPDGYLYIAMGDGGSGGDPQENGQDLGEILGKMLRIDIDNGNPYAIPPDNPFVGVSGAEEEIWALGLRNPWRFSFDRETGDMWIADVGQDIWEEVDFEPAGSSGGINYGWDCYEGDADFEGAGCLDESNYAFPIFVYPHNCNAGCPYGTGNSITGGFVYRGSQFTDLQGYYICVDYGSENIWLLDYDGVNVEITTQSGSGVFNRMATFGEDENGELYAATLDDVLYRVVLEGFLPVYLTGFRATIQDKTVALSWSVENIQDVEKFTVERSSNGIYFKTLGTVPAQPGEKDYILIDQQPGNAVNYYRLVTTLTDGAAQVSPVRSVDLRDPGIRAEVLTHAAGGLAIAMHGMDEEAEISIYTSDGKLIAGFLLDAAYHEVRASQNWNAGLYVVVIETPAQRWTYKWLKE